MKLYAEDLVAHLRKHVEETDTSIASNDTDLYRQLQRGRKDAYQHVLNELKDFEIKEET